jgi:peptidoglycan/xylan/chitin deacetylase (PgdA/CDA1 family)
VDQEWRSPLAVTPAAFGSHAAWLSRNRRVIALDEAAGRLDRRGYPPPGTAVLTFDDGLSGVYEGALPILRRHRLPATVFLVAGTLEPGGRTVDWVDTPSPHPLRTLTMEQVREMREDGIAFGSHSYAHHDLTAMEEAECERDLRQSRELLEDLLQARVRHLAYPRGRHDERVRRAASRAGFTHAYAGEREAPKRRELAGPPMAIPRIMLYPGNGVKALRLKMTRWYLPLRESPAYPLLRRMAGRPPRTQSDG